jgi:AsmA protein
MKKRGAAAWAGAIALTAALAACGLARWPVPTAWVQASLNAGSRGSTGLRWSAPVGATFRALPWPSLHFFNAQLDASGVKLLAAPEARLDLSLGELLRGRVVAARAALVNPIITIDLDAPPFAVRDGSTSAPGARRALSSLPSVSLTNGVLRVVDTKRGLDTVIEDVQGRLDGLAAGLPLRVDLSAVWRDSPLAISAFLADPDAASEDAPSTLRVVLVSSAGNLLFNGDLVRGKDMSFAGDLSVSVHSLASLTRLIGVDLPSVFATDDVAVSARIKATPDTVALDEATVTSSGQTLQGALQVMGLAGRPAISGTLDAERLALARLFGQPKPLVDRNGAWSIEPFGFAPPRNFDVDLRLSAGSLDVYGRGLANAAAALMLKDGALTASLIEAEAYRGRLSGEARVTCTEGDLDIHARAKLANADIGAAFSDLGWPVVTGMASAEFELATTGRSPAAAVAELSGSASMQWEQGAIGDVNLEEALRRSQRRPIDVARDMRIGGTAFDRMTLEFALGQGIAHVVHGDLSAQGVAANLQGAVDLPARSLNLRVNATQTDSAGAQSPDAAHLSLDIEGPWSSPAIRTSGEGITEPIDEGAAAAQ